MFKGYKSYNAKSYIVQICKITGSHSKLKGTD